MLSSKSFILSGLPFRSSIHLEFIFAYDVRECSNSILLHVAVQFSQYDLLKRLSFLHCISLPPLSKIRCPQCMGLSLGLQFCATESIFLFLGQYHTVLITIVQSEVRKVDSSSSILLSQDCFGYLGSFVFLYKLQIFSQFCERWHW